MWKNKNRKINPFLLQDGASFCGTVDVTCVQRAGLIGHLTEFLMKLKSEDEANKVPAGEIRTSENKKPPKPFCLLPLLLLPSANINGLISNQNQEGLIAVDHTYVMLTSSPWLFTLKPAMTAHTS